MSSLVVRVSVTFHLTCVHIIFSSVWVAECPPFGKTAAHSVDHMFSVYFDLFIILVSSRLGFEGWICVLIASVPDLCIRFSFINCLFLSERVESSQDTIKLQSPSIKCSKGYN